MFFIEDGLEIDNIVIDNLARYEYVNPTDTISVGSETHIKKLTVRDSILKNCLNNPKYKTGVGYVGDTNKIPEKNKDNDEITFLVNNGNIDILDIRGNVVDGKLFDNRGKVGNTIC